MNPFEILIEHCNETHPHMKSPRGQIDIAKAKAEHQALLAVAEAASKAVKASNSRFEHGIMTAAELASDTVVELAATELALATLAQIQKGE